MTINEQEMKTISSEDLDKIMERASEMVSTWPEWKRSPDVKEGLEYAGTIEDLDKALEDAKNKELKYVDPWPLCPELDEEIKQLYADHPELTGEVDPNAWIQTY